MYMQVCRVSSNINGIFCLRTDNHIVDVSHSPNFEHRTRPARYIRDGRIQNNASFLATPSCHPPRPSPPFPHAPSLANPATTSTMSRSARDFIRRADDDGSAGCPPGSVGCSTNPEEHDLTPSQSAALSMSMSASLSANTSGASVPSTSDVGYGYDPKATLGQQTLIGILAIIALLLIFTLGGVALICGCRGERCCKLRRQKNRSKPQVIHIDLRQESFSTSSTPDMKAEFP